jgi:sugar phosphate permease
MGVSEACYLPAALALVADYHRGPTRSLATGMHQTGVLIGFALGGLGGWLAEQRTWRYAFSLVGVVGLTYGLLLIFLLRDAPGASRGNAPGEDAKPSVRPGEALASLLGSGPYILALINWALLGITSWAVVGWMPVFLQERFHLGQGAAGFAASGYSNVAAIPGMLIGGIWADRWSRTNGAARNFVPAIGLLIAAPGILTTAHVGILGVAIAGIVCYRAFSGFVDSNMMPILCEIVDRRYRATAYGLMNMTGTIAGGLGIYGAGAMRDAKISLGVMVDLIAALTFVSPALFYFMKPRRPSPTK